MAFMQARKGGVPSFGLPRFPAAWLSVSGGMAFMQSRKRGVPSFGLPRFPAAYCTVTIMSFFVLLSAAPIDIVMVLSFSAVGASS